MKPTWIKKNYIYYYILYYSDSSAVYTVLATIKVKKRTNVAHGKYGKIYKTDSGFWLCRKTDEEFKQSFKDIGSAKQFVEEKFKNEQKT